MTPEEYTQECFKTWNYGRNSNEILKSYASMINAVMGIAAESGELLNQVKKEIFYGKPSDDAALVDELGDVLYYVAILADELGVTLEEVMQRNIDKLRERHGDKFRPAHYNGDGATTPPGLAWTKDGRALHVDKN